MTAGLWESLGCRRPAPKSSVTAITPTGLPDADSVIDGASSRCRARASKCCTNVRMVTAACAYPVAISTAGLILTEVAMQQRFGKSYVFQPNGELNMSMLGATAGAVIIGALKAQERLAARRAMCEYLISVKLGQKIKFR